MSDTLSVALYADYDEDTGGGGDLITGLWNMATKEFAQGYENPSVKKKKISICGIREMWYLRHDFFPLWLDDYI